MDCLKFFDTLRETFPEFTFEIEKDSHEEYAVYATDLELAGIVPGTIAFEIFLHGNGDLHCLFTFNPAKRTLEVMNLINKINDEASWAKGCLVHMNDQDYFQLHYAFTNGGDEDTAIKNIGFALADSASEPLTNVISAIYKVK